MAGHTKTPGGGGQSLQQGGHRILEAKHISETGHQFLSSMLAQGLFSSVLDNVKMPLMVLKRVGPCCDLHLESYKGDDGSTAM